MRRLMTGLALLLLTAAGAAAQTSGPNTRVDTNNSERPRQRYVCVVPAPDSAQQNQPNVCRAQAGRVGGSCRCNGVVGSGTLRLGY